jgi:hypothetical protein
MPFAQTGEQTNIYWYSSAIGIVVEQVGAISKELRSWRDGLNGQKGVLVYRWGKDLNPC